MENFALGQLVMTNSDFLPINILHYAAFCTQKAAKV